MHEMLRRFDPDTPLRETMMEHVRCLEQRRRNHCRARADLADAELAVNNARAALHSEQHKARPDPKRVEWLEWSLRHAEAALEQVLRAA